MSKTIILPSEVIGNIQDNFLNNNSDGWTFMSDLSGGFGGGQGFSKVIYQDEATNIDYMNSYDFSCLMSIKGLLDFLVATQKGFHKDDILLRVRVTRTYNYPLDVDENYHVDIPKDVKPNTKTIIVYLNDVQEARCGTQYIIGGKVYKSYHKVGCCITLGGEVPHKRFFDDEVKERVVLNINIGNYK